MPFGNIPAFPCFSRSHIMPISFCKISVGALISTHQRRRFHFPEKRQKAEGASRTCCPAPLGGEGRAPAARVAPPRVLRRNDSQDISVGTCLWSAGSSFTRCGHYKMCPTVSGKAWGPSKCFPYKLTVTVSLLYTILAYTSLHTSAVLLDNEGNLYRE